MAHWFKKVKKKKKINEKHEIAAATAHFAAQHDIFILLIRQMNKKSASIDLLKWSELQLS